MGGQGSGRKPDVLKRFTQSHAGIAHKGGEAMILPNHSGVTNHPEFKNYLADYYTKTETDAAIDAGDLWELDGADDLTTKGGKGLNIQTAADKTMVFNAIQNISAIQPISFAAYNDIGFFSFNGKISLNSADGVNMNSKKITSLATGTANTDAVNKGQMDTADALRVPYTGATTNVDLGSYDFTCNSINSSGDVHLNASGSLLTDFIGDGTGGGSVTFLDHLNMNSKNITNAATIDASGQISGGSFSTSGDISCDNLTALTKVTTYDLDVDTLNLNGNVISDSTGTISFSDENLTTTGDITADNITLNTGTNTKWESKELSIFGNQYPLLSPTASFGGTFGALDTALFVASATNVDNFIVMTDGSVFVQLQYDVSRQVLSFQNATFEFQGNVDIVNKDLSLDDNRKIYVGTGNDASIYYTGSNMVIDPKEVGSGGLEIQGDTWFSGSGTGLPFGEIYVNGNTTATTISTQNTWYQFTGFDTNGQSNLTTPDHTNDHITITKAGVYKIDFNVSFSGGGGKTYEVAVFKNNGATNLTNIHIERKLGTAGDIGAAAASGLCSCSANDTIELWIRCTDVTTANATIRDANLNLFQVGG